MFSVYVLLHALFAAHNSHFLARADEESWERTDGELNFWRVKFALLAVAIFNANRRATRDSNFSPACNTRVINHSRSMFVSTSTPSFKSLSGSCITRFISRCSRARVLRPHNMLTIKLVEILQQVLVYFSRVTLENSYISSLTFVSSEEFWVIWT
jgi:hypothetical protein